MKNMDHLESRGRARKLGEILIKQLHLCKDLCRTEMGVMNLQQPAANNCCHGQEPGQAAEKNEEGQPAEASKGVVNSRDLVLG